jgi:hypothetical protein
MRIDRRRTTAIAQGRRPEGTHQSRPADLYHADSGQNYASTAPRDRSWRHRAEIRYVRLLLSSTDAVWRTSDSLLYGEISCSTMQGESEVTSNQDFFCRG